MAANKNDVEVAKLFAKSESTESIIGIIKLLLICGTVICSLIILKDCLVSLRGSGEGEINAMAKLVEALKLETILHYLIDAGLLAGFLIQKNAKKRYIKKYSQLKQRLDGDDPQRSSSGLTETGETKK